MCHNDPELEIAQPDIAQTITDLSNVVMSNTLLENQPKTVSKPEAEGVVLSDFFGGKAAASSNANVTVTNKDGKVSIQFNLTSCKQRISSMKDLDLQMSMSSILLIAPKCNESWSDE